MTILHVSSADKRQEFTLVQDSFTGLLTRNFCKRSFIPQAMTHADLRPLRRSIGIDPFHFILVFASMFRVLKSFGLFFRSSLKIRKSAVGSASEIVTIYPLCLVEN